MKGLLSGPFLRDATTPCKIYKQCNLKYIRMFGAPITFLQYFKKIKPGADKGRTLFELAFRYHFRQSTLYIDSYKYGGECKRRNDLCGMRKNVEDHHSLNYIKVIVSGGKRKKPNGIAKG